MRRVNRRSEHKIVSVAPHIEWDDYWDKPSARINCPVCADSYQHHAETIVFDRPREDGPTTAISLPSGNAVSEKNPSSRRDAVRVNFYGECGHEWSLDIVQHKGETFLFATWTGTRDDSDVPL